MFSKSVLVKSDNGSGLQLLLPGARWQGSVLLPDSKRVVSLIHRPAANSLSVESAMFSLCRFSLGTLPSSHCPMTSTHR